MFVAFSHVACLLPKPGGRQWCLIKIFFSLRTCPPNFIRDALTSFDDTIRETLSTLVGSPLKQWSWIKASLPCNLGGLGLRSAVDHAPAAYFSSLSQQAPLISAILGRESGTFPYLATTVHLLASARGEMHYCTGVLTCTYERRVYMHVHIYTMYTPMYRVYVYVHIYIYTCICTHVYKVHICV